jgi:hypothetical protein
MEAGLESSDTIVAPIKKSRSEHFGIFVSRIPKHEGIDEVSNYCSDCANFVPSFRRKHMSIAYFLFTGPEQRDLQIKMLQNKSNGVSALTFDNTQTNFNFPIDNLISVFELFVNIEKYYVMTEKLDHESSQKVSEILSNSRLECEQILCYNYKPIHISFQAFKQDINVDSNYEDIEWRILLIICYFLSFKLNLENIPNNLFFFSVFIPKRVRMFFEELKVAEPVIKFFAFDILFQLTRLKNPFQEKEEVMDGMLNIVTKNKTYLLSHLRPAKIDFFRKVLNLDLFKNFLNVENHDLMISKFLSRTCLVLLPSSIQGITLANGYILIKTKSKTISNYDAQPALWGFTFVTIIHELGHFAQRFIFLKEIEWFEHKSPKTEKKEGKEERKNRKERERDEEKEEGKKKEEEKELGEIAKLGGVGREEENKKNQREAGSDLVKFIFGEDIENITLKASIFILKFDNWKLSQEDFKEKFSNLNPYDPNDRYELGKVTNTKLKQSGNLRLKGCKFSITRGLD